MRKHVKFSPRGTSFAEARWLLVLSLAASLGCKLDGEGDSPTGPSANDAVQGSSGTSVGTGTSTSSPNITSPIIADPLAGSTVGTVRPALTVLNSARATQDPATYLFQVAADSGFGALSAQSAQVSEGADGSTSWTVDRDLAEGRYFWRVRARSGTVDSEFSSTADFIVGDAPPGGTTPSPPPSPSPGGGTIISDPLIGGSLGEVFGGNFTSAGWRVTSPGNFIRYEVPTLESGFVEFDTSGLQPVNPSPDQFMLFGMWDPSAGDYRANRYRVHLQKLHPNPHNPPYLRMRWIANGEQHDEGNNFVSWDPSRTYRWRIEWGPSGSGHTARVFLDGELMIVVNYNRAYRPNLHFVELGIGERGESVVGATYSNFRIGQ